jgi:hypothetical protein
MTFPSSLQEVELRDIYVQKQGMIFRDFYFYNLLTGTTKDFIYVAKRKNKHHCRRLQTFPIASEKDLEMTTELRLTTNCTLKVYPALSYDSQQNWSDRQRFLMILSKKLTDRQHFTMILRKQQSADQRFPVILRKNLSDSLRFPMILIKAKN